MAPDDVTRGSRRWRGSSTNCPTSSSCSGPRARCCGATRGPKRCSGTTLEDYKGRSAIDFVHPDDLELVGRSLVSIQNKEIGTTLEVRAKTPSGWRLIELIGAPVSWFAEGAVLFTMRDLTERRRFEVARNEVDRFRSLVHNAATITMLVSSHGRDRIRLGGLDANARARPRARRVHAAEPTSSPMTTGRRSAPPWSAPRA